VCRHKWPSNESSTSITTANTTTTLSLSLSQMSQRTCAEPQSYSTETQLANFKRCYYYAIKAQILWQGCQILWQLGYHDSRPRPVNYPDLQCRSIRNVGYQLLESHKMQKVRQRLDRGFVADPTGQPTYPLAWLKTRASLFGTKFVVIDPAFQKAVPLLLHQRNSCWLSICLCVCLALCNRSTDLGFSLVILRGGEGFALC